MYLNFYQRMGILPLKKRVNRGKCSFATKQRMFGVFAIDEFHLLSRKSLFRFLHLMPPCIRKNLPNQTLLSGNHPVAAHNVSFALKHSGQNACGIPGGQTIIMTGGGNSDRNHNFVTRWGISLNYIYTIVVPIEIEIPKNSL